MKKHDEEFAKTISQLIDCNPFDPDRTRLERLALGDSFNETEADWTLHPVAFTTSDNLTRLETMADEVLDRLGRDFDKRQSVAPRHCQSYCDVGYYALYSRFRADFEELTANPKNAARVYGRFSKQFSATFDRPWLADDIALESPHMFALLFQVYRAFRNLFDHLIGGSDAIIKLRARVWQSIFTCDFRRYRSSLYRRMADFSTLVTGPSGTGKELVARAIGLSSYVPFDEQRNRFVNPAEDIFCSLNLTAMNPSLIESDLFGHRKGAFTGADRDRTGWLEACPEFGTVFLDEVGELDETIQIKLLRVLQEREFLPVGDSQIRTFKGRIIAATNRDIGASIQDGTLRRDFVYRIRSDHIEMPSLAQRCAGAKQELGYLVEHLLHRITDTSDPSLAQNILTWIHTHLGPAYAWPGNVRELEQCIRSYVLRREYEPITSTAQASELDEALANCGLTADELVTRLCQVAYASNRSYVATAKQLGLDRRTVKSRVDPQPS